MKKLVTITAMALFMASGQQIMAEKIVYPQAPTDSTVIDNYFGILLADPYRPLEDDNAQATLDWVKAENAVTRQWLDSKNMDAPLRSRLQELYNFGRRGTPWLGNDGRWYVFDNSGLQNQSVLYTMNKPGGKMKLYFDPNKLSKDGTVALKSIEQSESGKYTAYSVSRGGSDWEEIYVMDTKTGKLLPDHIEWAKFTTPQWKGDEGFYYSAYPRPEKGQELSQANEYHSVYFHKLGTPQSEDKIVFEDRDKPLHFHQGIAPKGSGLLFVTGSGEGTGNSLAVRGQDDDAAAWKVMEPSQDYDVTLVGVRDGKIYLMTVENAPKGHLMVADVENPEKSAWRELVPEAKGVLKGVDFTGDKMLLTYESDASAHVEIFDMDGTPVGEMKLPGYGSVAISSSKEMGDDIYYKFASFTTPGTIMHRNLKTGKEDVWYEPALKGINPDDYITEQVFFTSKDGTKVPMFLTYKKGLEKDGNNPVYIYGYGGFNISLTPAYAPNKMLWLDNGGIYASVNLRGGAEYGEEWHEAGTQLNKQNVFDDFIAASEYMVKEGWTKPELMVAEGGSNGGLLIGAVANQRPDLWKVAIPRVGVMDMMRYHLFTIGWNWAADYGRSDRSPEMAKYLLGYSPLHNVRGDGTPYPAILVTTADHDDRVVPAHSFKYAAQLQQANTGDAPKLIRIDVNAGHGGGKPISKVIDEWVDLYTFIFSNLGRQPK